MSCVCRLVARNSHIARYGPIRHHIPSCQSRSGSLTSRSTVVATPATWKCTWCLSFGDSATLWIRAWVSAPCFLLAFAQGSRDRVNGRTYGETASNNQQEGFASQIIYIFVILASKLSVLSLYLRLSPGGSHRIASWSLVALSCLWALISVILIAIPCNPAQTYTDADNCTNRVSQLDPR